MARTSEEAYSDNGVEVRQLLRDKVEAIRFCMFTTVEPDGSLRSRPLTTQQIEADGTVWFFVSASGEVASTIAQNPQVNLAYADRDDNVYATLRGSAAVVRDPVKAEELWSTMAGAWFPGGPKDPDLALIRVDVDEAEYWKPEGTKVGQFVSIYKAALTGTPPKPGEHRAVHF